MGIITNRTSPIDGLLDQLGLTAFFPWVIVSGKVGITKPEAGIFHLALEQSQANAQTTLYVGDNYYADVIGAQNAGLTPVLVDPEGLFPEAQCPVIDSLADLPELLREFAA